MLHGDFNNRNIVVAQKEGSWQVGGIIDWEAARAASAIEDVSSPADWWRMQRAYVVARNCLALASERLPQSARDEIAALVIRAIAEEC